jgi:hypothetical protein
LTKQPWTSTVKNVDIFADQRDCLYYPRKQMTAYSEMVKSMLNQARFIEIRFGILFPVKV